MDKPKKIYVDDYMPDDEETEKSPNKTLNREQYEEYKSKFNIKDIISTFILK